MKKNKLLAILLCVAMIFTQFSMLGIVFADGTISATPAFPSNIDKVVMDGSFSKILGEGISIQHVPENGGYSVRQSLHPSS